MNLFFRLYYPADLDLLLMKRNMGKRFPQFVRNCLKNALNGGQSEYDPASVPSTGMPKMLSSCCINIQLNETDDAELIAFLQSFPQNARSSVVKKILSGCSAYFPTDVYEAYAGMEHICKSRPAVKSMPERKPSEPQSSAKEHQAQEPSKQQSSEQQPSVQHPSEQHSSSSSLKEGQKGAEHYAAESPHDMRDMTDNSNVGKHADVPEEQSSVPSLKEKSGLDKRHDMSENSDEIAKPAPEEETASVHQKPDAYREPDAHREPELDSDDDMMELLSGMVNHR